MLKECRNCPELVVVPAGTFMMGSPADEPERRPSERHHKVTIARAFAIGKTQVTWDQWEACVRDRWCDGPAVEHALRTLEADGQPNPNYKDYGRGTRPVVGVSWFDAQTFVGWLNWKTGEDDAYRLPSDAEWEYAARAGTTTAYPWGAKLDHNYGNFGIVGPGLGGKVEGRDQWADETAPVGVVPAQRVRPLRHARQRLRVGGGLLRGGPRARAGGRLGEQGGQLRQPRVPQRHVPQQSLHAPLGETRGAVSGHAPRAQLSRVPRRQDIGVRGEHLCVA